MIIAYTVGHESGTNYGIITAAGFNHSVLHASDGTDVKIHSCDSESAARQWLIQQLGEDLGEMQPAAGGFIGYKNDFVVDQDDYRKGSLVQFARPSS